MVRVIRFMKRTNTNVAVHLALQELTAKRHLVSSVAQILAFGPLELQSLYYATRLALANILRLFFSIFAEIHSSHPISTYIFLLSPTLGLPTRFIDALFGFTGISGWTDLYEYLYE